MKRIIEILTGIAFISDIYTCICLSTEMLLQYLRLNNETVKYTQEWITSSCICIDLFSQIPQGPKQRKQKM